MKLLQWLSPDMYIHSLADISYELLEQRGVVGLIVDLDNTLVPWHEDEPDQQTASWLKGLLERNVSVCVVSNNLPFRVDSFCRRFGIKGIAKASKPLGQSFRRAIGILGTEASTTAVIGDQLFTDVLGGKLVGLYTILVSPRTDREFVGTKCVRVLERLVLARMRQAGYLNKDSTIGLG